MTMFVTKNYPDPCVHYVPCVLINPMFPLWTWGISLFCIRRKFFIGIIQIRVKISPVYVLERKSCSRFCVDHMHILMINY